MPMNVVLVIQCRYSSRNMYWLLHYKYGAALTGPTHVRGVSQYCGTLINKLLQNF